MRTTPTKLESRSKIHRPFQYGWSNSNADADLEIRTADAKRRISIHDHLPLQDNNALIQTVLKDILKSPRSISSKFFYDTTGSKLFEEITRLPEYHPPRAEKKLLRRAARPLSQKLQDIDIIELGSGDCSKISILLDAAAPAAIESIRYIPMDVSADAIERSARMLAGRYPRLKIHGLVADFMTQLELVPNQRRRLFCFFGSTIGNFTYAQRTALLSSLRKTLHRGDSLIVGMDLVKPRDVLERAYNDGAGITARFNRNILSVVNTIAGTDFDAQLFDHVAFYNEQHSRIEMHLEARAPMRITSPHLNSEIFLVNGERIHTENSHKFTRHRIAHELSECGLHIESFDVDQEDQFALVHISRAP